MSIHPKTSGAAVGAALGVLIVAVLQSVHGVHMAPELPGAITAFLAMAGSWLVPSGDPLPVPVPVVPPAAVVPVTQPQPVASPPPPAVPPAV